MPVFVSFVTVLLPVTLVAQQRRAGRRVAHVGRRPRRHALRAARSDQRRSNFSKLEIAWRFKTDNLGSRPDFNLQTTPLMVNGVLYVTAGEHRNAVAVDAATGEMLWMHRLEEGKRAQLSSRRLSGRGVGYWTDGKGDERIFYVTIGYQLVGLDAKTGRPLKDFGANGVVDLKKDIDQELDLIERRDRLERRAGRRRRTSSSSARRTGPGAAPRSNGEREGLHPRLRRADRQAALDLPHHSAARRVRQRHVAGGLVGATPGNTGVWTQMTVDEELGIAYLPVEIPTGDYFGGHRPGNNLFAESLVAVELETGKRIWHFQFVHHPIWDYDVPCAPILADITVDGRHIKAIAQPTKQGFLYVFDRVTGEPVWPIEERPVEQGNVPREWYSPTQPFPTKPPPFERQGFLEDYVIDFTPELKAEGLKTLSRSTRLAPSSRRPSCAARAARIGRSSSRTAPNWPGGSFDPETGMLYVYSHTLLRVLSMVNDPKRSDMNYISAGGGGDESRRRAERAGPAARQAAMGTHHRHRPEPAATSPGRSRTAKRRTRSRTTRR